MSGYDIKQFLEQFSWLIGSPSFGSLYPALHALLEEGLVSVDITARADKPLRKIYSITNAGRAALHEWLGQLTLSDAPLKSFVMCLILAENLSPAGLATYLHHRRDQVADHLTGLSQTVGTTDDALDLGQRLALDYGLAIATAELSWLDSTLAGLAG